MKLPAIGLTVVVSICFVFASCKINVGELPPTQRTAVLTPTKNEAYFAFTGEVMKSLLVPEPDQWLSYYHFPESSTIDEDKGRLAEAIRIVSEEFGPVQSYAPWEGALSAHLLMLASGSHKYWLTQPGAFRYAYAVEFDRQGRGWVLIDVVEDGGRPRVKQLIFALPTSKPGAEEFVHDVLLKIAPYGDQMSKSQALTSPPDERGHIFGVQSGVTSLKFGLGALDDSQVS